MPTCLRCNNFYIGFECPYCRTDPRLIREEQEASATQQKNKDFLLITSPILDGYRITEYYGIVTGSCVIGTGFLSEFKASFSDFFGSSSEAFSAKLEKVKDASMIRARDNAISLGANALIGVQIDFHGFTANMIACIASGTAVRIEKI